MQPLSIKVTPSCKVKCKFKKLSLRFPQTLNPQIQGEVSRTQFTQTEISKEMGEIPYSTKYFLWSNTHKAGVLVT